MLRLPRTVAPPRRQQQGQPTPSGYADLGAGSPTDVLTALPLRPRSRANSGVLARPPGEAPEGHARDILHLFHSGWFGPLSKSKAGAGLQAGEEEDDDELPASPVHASAKRGRLPRQHAQPVATGRHGGSDASPSTSSQRSAGGGASGLPQPTPSQRIGQRQNTQQQQAQAAAMQDLPGIGTWAGRYRLFGRQQSAAAALPPQPAAAAASEQQQQPAATAAASSEEQQQATEDDVNEDDLFGSPVVLRPGPFEQEQGRAQQSGHMLQPYGSEQLQEDAWRWRFSRKWATEQQKYQEVGQAHSMVSDDLEALQYTQACGVGQNLQVMPTSRPRPAPQLKADDGQLGLENSSSTLSLCQFDVEQSYASQGALSAEMSPGNSAHGARAAAHLLRTGSHPLHPPPYQPQGTPSPRLPSATKSVLSLANKAKDLMQKQGEIEQEVQDRWDRSRTASDAWAGRSLDAVKIDTWGRFKFSVLRISDGSGHTRFLVRGRSGVSPSTLLEEAVQEAAAASRAKGLPAATVEVVGGGVMEWREDTERELHLTPSNQPGDGMQQRKSDSPTQSPYLSDVSGLTASLVRQSLPCHFRITTGDGASRAGSVAALGNWI